MRCRSSYIVQYKRSLECTTRRDVRFGTGPQKATALLGTRCCSPGFFFLPNFIEGLTTTKYIITHIPDPTANLGTELHMVGSIYFLGKLAIEKTFVRRNAYEGKLSYPWANLNVDRVGSYAGLDPMLSHVQNSSQAKKLIAVMLHNGLLQLSLDNAKARYMGSQTGCEKLQLTFENYPTRRRSSRVLTRNTSTKFPSISSTLPPLSPPGASLQPHTSPRTMPHTRPRWQLSRATPR